MEKWVEVKNRRIDDEVWASIAHVTRVVQLDDGATVYLSDGREVKSGDGADVLLERISRAVGSVFEVV